MKNIVEVNSWSALGPEARPIREQVFCIEQNIPKDLEWDEMDELSLHAIARDASGRAIGTGRLLPDGHIGRMAVVASARGGGNGGRILETLVATARQRGHGAVVLHAQTAVVPFYLAHGFIAEGAEFMEAGIPHQTMRRTLAPL